MKSNSKKCIELLSDSNIFRLGNHRIIFSGIEDIKEDLKNYFRILLLKEHPQTLKHF